MNLSGDETTAIIDNAARIKRKEEEEEVKRHINWFFCFPSDCSK